jgi:hypothetical protein
MPSVGCIPMPLRKVSKHHNTQLRCLFIQIGMSDNGYQIKLCSDIQYNVGLCSLSPISEVPILLITDIGLSAHLCLLPISLLLFHKIILSINIERRHTNLPY